MGTYRMLARATHSEQGRPRQLGQGCLAAGLGHQPRPDPLFRRALSRRLPQVWNTAYQVVAQRQRGAAADFSFRAFMDGPVARVRRKPARARCERRAGRAWGREEMSGYLVSRDASNGWLPVHGGQQRH